LLRFDLACGRPDRALQSPCIGRYCWDLRVRSQLDVDSVVSAESRPQLLQCRARDGGIGQFSRDEPCKCELVRFAVLAREDCGKKQLCLSNGIPPSPVPCLYK